VGPLALAAVSFRRDHHRVGAVRARIEEVST